MPCEYHECVASREEETCVTDREEETCVTDREEETCVTDREEETFECFAAFYCIYCGAGFPFESAAIACCESDNAAEYAAEDDSEFADDHGEHTYPYRLPVGILPNRPARLCSIEQEVVVGGVAIARDLHAARYCQYPELVSYLGAGDPGRAVVKEDGSLPEGGGEVVYSRFQLWKNQDEVALSQMLARVRDLWSSGAVRCGRAAGTHIHIAAKAEDGSTLLPQHIAALHEVFCHLEDPLYGLAAAGWPEHRLTYADDGYCKILPKVEDATAAKVARVMRRDRYYGVNFLRLFESVAECNCGACLVGAWNECECGALESATVEFRLWNSSTKPETLHAWLLLSHGLVAYATRHRLGTVKPTPFRSGTPTSRWNQLRWFLRRAPYTAEERKVIRAAAHRSPGFSETNPTY